MSLATRCPSCGTVFRVVQDQLRVSEGWVRCGRCSGVFEATEALFDIDTGAPRTLGSEPAPPPPPAARPADDDDGLPTPKDWAQREAARRPAPAAAPAADLREEPLLRAPSVGHDDEIVVTDHISDGSAAAALAASVAAARHPRPAAVQVPEPAAAAPAAAAAAADAPAVEPATVAQATPSFVRAAERARRWQSPLARGLLACGALLLGGLLVLQVARVWRDPLAAHLPATRPALQALCQATGCAVQPLRRLDALAVGSSGLNRLEGSTLYRLQLVLNNRADTPVMMPALELTLNDTRGQVVARRVLPVAELGAPQATLQPGQELALQALLSTGERRVDGYTLELFYP